MAAAEKEKSIKISKIEQSSSLQGKNTDQGSSQEESKQQISQEEQRTDQKPLDLSIYPKDDKGRYIIPTDVFLSRYRELPAGTRTGDGRYIAYNGGYCKTLTDEDRDKGRDTKNAKLERRRTFKDAILEALYSKAPSKTIKDLGLDENADNLAAIIANQIRISTEGKKGEATSSAEFIRDTIGEKPADRQEITADIMTDEDRALLRKVRARQLKAAEEQEMQDH